MAHGIEVIFPGGKRKVWRADEFHLEQQPSSWAGGKLGDTAWLVVGRTVAAPPNTSGPPQQPDVVARIPSWCWVHPITLDETSNAVQARLHIESGQWLDETKVEPEPKEPLPKSIDGPDKLPMAPKGATATVTPSGDDVPLEAVEKGA